MSIKLPLLAEPRLRVHAAGARSTPIEPHARALAARSWLAIIGAPGDEAPARFACALSNALAACSRHALLSSNAPIALELALQAAGCQPIRATETAGDRALQRALTAVPVDGIVLVVESELAAQLRGLLDVWVGAAPNVAPGIALDTQLSWLYAAADVVLPGAALGTALALGAALALRINDHTNAA